MLRTATPTVTKTRIDLMAGVRAPDDGTATSLAGEWSQQQLDKTIVMLDELARQLAQTVFRVDQHLSRVKVMSAIGQTHLEQATRLVHRTLDGLLGDPCRSLVIQWLNRQLQGATRAGLPEAEAVVLLAGLFAGRERSIVCALTCGLSGDTLEETETIHHRILQSLAAGNAVKVDLPILVRQMTTATEALNTHLARFVREDNGWPKARRLIKEVNRALAGLILICRGEAATRAGSLLAGEATLLTLLGGSVVGLAGRHVSAISLKLMDEAGVETFHPGLVREQQDLLRLLQLVAQGKIEALAMAEKVETLQRWAYLAQQTGLPDDEALQIEVESLIQLADAYGGLAGYLQANLPRLLRILYRKVSFEPVQREQLAALYRYLGGVWLDIKRNWLA